MQQIYEKQIDSPVGPLRLRASDKGLCEVVFPNSKGKSGCVAISADHPVLCKAEKQLAEYFAGIRKTFDLALDMQGSVFQIKAWRALQQIPYGQTLSYGEQAEAIGDKKKARAVGAANGRNPLSIVVPCHRVIGKSGALTGFGGGLKTKEYLLKHEQAVVAALTKAA